MTLPRPTVQLGSGSPTVGDDPLASPRIRALAMEIAYRLRPLCEDLPEGELVRLVTQVALVQHGASRTGRATT